MNNEFRILNESTINFKSNKIYIMLLKEFGEYGVEVASKNEGFGRKFAENKDKAIELFDALGEKLNDIKSFEQAKERLKSYFKIKDINEILFLLKSEDVVRSQVSIGDLYIYFKLKTKVKYDTKGDDHCLGAITIYTFFKNRRKAIGRFIGTRFGEDFVFEKL